MYLFKCYFLNFVVRTFVRFMPASVVPSKNKKVVQHLLVKDLELDLPDHCMRCTLRVDI